MPLRFKFAFVDIDDVGKSLESIERYSNRQDDVESETIDMEREEVEEIDRTLNEEVEIFEEYQCPDTDDNREYQPEFLHRFLLCFFNEYTW